MVAAKSDELRDRDTSAGLVHSFASVQASDRVTASARSGKNLPNLLRQHESSARMADFAVSGRRPEQAIQANSDHSFI